MSRARTIITQAPASGEAYAALPKHLRSEITHPFQGTLALLDPMLGLVFNNNCKRYEVWRLVPHINELVFVLRVVADRKGGGYAEPGAWLVPQLRGMMPAFRDAREIAKEAMDEMRAHNQAQIEAARADKKRDIGAMIRDHLPLWRRKVAGDHLFGKVFLGGSRSRST